MYILADPERARRMGLIGQKAQLRRRRLNWTAYFGFLAQATTVGGFVLFAFVAAWVFGRQFSDGARPLPARRLPTSRSAIIAAKLVVVARGARRTHRAGRPRAGRRSRSRPPGGASADALRSKNSRQRLGGAGLTFLIVLPVAPAGRRQARLPSRAGFAVLMLHPRAVIGTNRAALVPSAMPAPAPRYTVRPRRPRRSLRGSSRDRRTEPPARSPGRCTPTSRATTSTRPLHVSRSPAVAGGLRLTRPGQGFTGADPFRLALVRSMACGTSRRLRPWPGGVVVPELPGGR